ncbi:unnamed protein product [Arctia plantaginis]|uniref:Uncharacterized protein n=1 Tax=Arctia plantaginis TaxID=874455 RepID=A0A8S0Z847_ARCPL|nr:unnamed protein product [Arctia plantaginis]
MIWVCPDCVSLKPKPKNSDDTPVRGNKVHTPCYVSTQRGSRSKFSPTIAPDYGIVTDRIDSQLLEEFRELRSVMMLRMDSQANAIKDLQNQFCQTKTDLDRLIKMISALDEKCVRRPSESTRQQQEATDILHETSSSFYSCNITKGTHEKNPPHKTSNQKSSKGQRTANIQDDNNSGATKSSAASDTTSGIDSSPMSAQRDGNNTIGGWIMQKKKSSSGRSKIVGTGKNTQLMAIQAT